jgi:hypothetical protein
MISAILAATVLFFQAAPTAEHAASATSAAPAKSVSPVTVTGQGGPAKVDDGATVVCHDEKVLGTLFPQRVCGRKDELLARRREDQAEHRRNTALRPWRDPAS